MSSLAFWTPAVSTAVALLAVGASNLAADERFDGLDRYVATAMSTWSVPGLSLAVVKDGQTVLSRSYGICELGTTRNVNEHTLFPIASCAKSMVAASVAFLVEDNKLHWDDPVVQHLPEFELSNRYLTEHLTLRDLLCHRTGLQRCDLLMDHTEPDRVLSRLKYIPVVASPRTSLTYSNPMYFVLHQVVERVSQQPWEQFVDQRLFQPLGMNATYVNLPPESARRIAIRHWRSDQGIVSRSAADRGIHSTLGDMTRWVRFQLADGQLEGRRLLQAQTIREMHALQFSVTVRYGATDNIYAAHFYGSGLGWMVQDYRGHKIVSHGGSWGAMVAMMPDQNLGVIVLSNLDLSSLPALLMYDVFDAYLIGAQSTWDATKWKRVWLRNEPPGVAYLPRDTARAKLEETRRAATTPSLPMGNYAGQYESPLYGRIVVTHDPGQLKLTFGDYTTGLEHWHVDSFYARTPTRLTFDWLVTFDVSQDGHVRALAVKHIGWDQQESDHVFGRVE